MSLFESIKSAIFGRGASTASTPSKAPAAKVGSATSPSRDSAPSGVQPAPSRPVPQSTVDVEAVLNGLAAKNPQKLNWQSSIVDLMKLLDLDPSLQNRKELAKELGYSGDTADTAAMNTWLHKQVMRKLAESGGKVPASLRD